MQRHGPERRGRQRTARSSPADDRAQFGASLRTPPSAGPEVSRWSRGWRPTVAWLAMPGDLATTRAIARDDIPKRRVVTWECDSENHITSPKRKRGII